MTQRFRLLLASSVGVALAVSGCARTPASKPAQAPDAAPLVGAWHSRISFRNGAFASVNDLEFLYAYNAGGTMTESSNYDESANSSPPAYGAWKQTAPGTFTTKYLFFTTRPPNPKAGEPKSGDWWPAGHGELSEVITLAADGQSYTSTIKLATFDANGNPIADGTAEGTGSARRIAPPA